MLGFFFLYFTKKPIVFLIFMKQFEGSLMATPTKIINIHQSSGGESGGINKQEKDNVDIPHLAVHC
jgi:hypothetical protein